MNSESNFKSRRDARVVFAHALTRHLQLLRARLVLPCLLFGACWGALQAQAQVTFEYAGMFGQQGYYDRSQGVNQVPPNGFSSPTGVAFKSAERIIVADRGNQKLQSCDLQGVCSWIGNDAFQFRNQPGAFDRPHGVAVTSTGRIAVADEDNHAVQLCDINGDNCLYSGQTTSANNPPHPGLGRWAYPHDVAVDSQDRIFGLDTENNRIQILDAENLRFLDLFMTQGAGLGEVSNPQGIAIDALDRIIISDTDNSRIQICSTVPECTTFGSAGNAAGQFRGAVGVEADALGRIWVADTGNHRIQACDEHGDCMAFGSFGSGPGEFDTPSDVAVHPSGLVAVVDTGNQRIQLFRTESAFRINAGLNDAWYNPATPGQGFFVNVFPDLGKILIAMFTFDTERPAVDVMATLGEPGHRWLTALGDYSGNSAVLDIELTTGGVFDSGLPEVLQDTRYGTFTIEFENCIEAFITYQIPSLSLEGEMPVTRIAHDNVELCETLSSLGD